jgi:protein phosphatase
MTDPHLVAPPDGPPLELDAFGLTHQGLVRGDNQDHFLLCSLYKSMRVHGTSLPRPDTLERESHRLAVLGVVADGVGGRSAGEAASRAAIETIATYITHTMRCYYTSDPTEAEAFLTALRQVAFEAHRAVIARAEVQPDLLGMATTLTLGVGVWPSLFVLQVGDSRGYLLRGDRLQQLTKDQTVAQELVDQGLMRQSAAFRSPLAHVLASAIGSQAEPEVERIELERGDVVLLCSDGLTKHVPDERIRDHLVGMTSAEKCCRALVDEALAGGGTDNVTVIVVREKPVPG